MFEIKTKEDRLVLCGRLDASQVDKAIDILNQVKGTTTVDLSELEYVSSAGLGVLVATQKRLVDNGGSLHLVNMTPHVRSVFHYASLNKIFPLD